MSPRRRGYLDFVRESIATGDGTPEHVPGLLDFDADDDLGPPDEGPPSITHEDLVREMPRGTRIRTIGPQVKR